jgi:uncharacterized protein YbaP (TraB family)
MRFRRTLVAVAATLAALAGWLAAAAAAAPPPSFAWKVTGHGGSLYLVGSVHLLTADFYPLPPALEAAYADSDQLVEEVNIGDMLAPQAQLSLLTQGILPANQSLPDVVSAETVELVKKRAAAVGLPYAPLARMKPWFLSLTLTALEWTKAGFDENLGLDMHFYQQATADGKPVQGLETIAYQVSRFDGMSPKEQEALLTSSLEEMDDQIENITALTGAWKQGNAREVERLVLADVQSDPALYDRLLVERNRNWLPQIEALFARPGHALVVVGAAHLVGPDGLLKMLEARGYTIEQL